MTKRKENRITIPASQFITESLATLTQTQEEKVKQWNQASADINAVEKHLKAMNLQRDHVMNVDDECKLMWSQEKKRLLIQFRETDGDGDSVEGIRQPILKPLLECEIAVRMAAYHVLTKFLDLIKDNLIKEVK